MIARNCLGNWLLATSGLILSNLLGVAQVAIAQVVPDETLPTKERTQVLGDRNFQIDGGATRGSNLFHSFSQFSVPTGGEVYFNNAANIQNIFSRVTGGSISNIDGLIRANGTANLFLLNPNGIIFGPNARLKVGGSFVGSTANSINFADNFEFSATNPQSTPLLTVTVPIGLQVGANPGKITVQGNGYDLSKAYPISSPFTRGNSSTGLRVPAGETLALVGGDVEIQGGTLTAEQGRIELGSVRNGQVWLNPLSEGFALSYPRIQSFGNIRLLQQALADASAGGSVQVHGNQVSLNDGSIILIQNQGQQQGGSISVNAAYSVNLSGHNSTDSLNGGLNSETIGNGHGADIAITAQQLVLQQGAVIIASSYGSGKTGNITVNADSKVQVIAFSPPNPINNSVIAATTSGSGDGGDITLSTGQLTILNGGGIGTQVLPKSTGRGGDVTINARESTEVIGAAVLPEGITVSSVAAITTGDGNAGKVIINTPRLVAENGGSVSTSTIEAAGSAGSLIINATESVDVRGGVQQRISTPSVDGEFSYLSLVGASGIVTLLGTPEAVRGASGNVTINTSSLSVTNGAGIEVSNQGTGDAGNLQINAKSVVLDSGGAITAATASGEGGNIQLQVRDLLLIRRNSEITASASGTGNGGNININTPFLVAVPNENSNISANSVNARGGNVTINTNGIFGFQFRPQGTLLSNITATGGNSALNGTVRINVENIIPTSGLVKLPSVLVDINALIANSCIARNSQKSRFIITGSGSLPTLPDELANSGFPTYELVPSTSDLPIGIQQSNNSNQSHAAIVEPDGIYQLSNGEVVLGRSCR